MSFWFVGTQTRGSGDQGTKVLIKDVILNPCGEGSVTLK